MGLWSHKGFFEFKKVATLQKILENEILSKWIIGVYGIIGHMVTTKRMVKNEYENLKEEL